MFGFECECERCENEDGRWQLVERSLDAPSQELTKCSQEERSLLLHNMRLAHASICVMSNAYGKPVGFKYREFDNWTEAQEAAEEVYQCILAAGANTNWMACHVRELRCRALEETHADSKAFLLLAEQVHVLWRLLPRYCSVLMDLQLRLEDVRKRIPAVLANRLEERANKEYGESL